MTSLTDIAAFAIGTVSALPAIQVFLVHVNVYYLYVLGDGVILLRALANCTYHYHRDFAPTQPSRLQVTVTPRSLS